MIKLPISPSATDSLAELKHSIYMHVLLQGGPSPQLSVFLVKLLDLIDDFYVALNNEQEQEQRLERIEQECGVLSFHIIESLALWLQQAIDVEKVKAKTRGEIFPISAASHGDQLLILVGKSRSLPDKKAAKSAVLRGIAEAFRALQSYTKDKYPEIRDIKNNVL